MKIPRSILLVILVLSFLSFGFQPAPDSNDIGPIIGLITARALQLAGPVKLIVDRALKGWLGASGNKLALAACGLGILIDFGVIAIGQGAAGFTMQSSVMAVIAGVLAGLGSKALTDNHDATHV